MKRRRPLTDERGVALAMTLIVMVLLTTLIVAFVVLATSEPQIANNQATSAQARALAESGVERALWALSAGGAPSPPSGALVLDASYNLPSPMPAPYDGSTFVSVSARGGFTVTVANGTQPNQKVVTAVGFVPNATNPTAVKKITTTVTRISWINPICGLCAGGGNPPGTTTVVQVGGSATVNATTSAQGGTPAGAYCPGVTPTAAVATTGTVSTNGNPSLYAPDPNNPGQTLTGTQATQNNASFPSTMLLSDADIATLKAMAKNMGPGHYFSGAQTWTSPPTNGLIFVDTPSGNPLTTSSPSSDLISVDISGNWSSGWSGWLIIAGSAYIHGNITMSGLIYAQNDVTIHGSGNGSISGAVITTNRIDTSSTNVDSTDVGNAPIIYNCPATRTGGGQLSQNWFIMPGTYQEISGR
jgi:Tfp pilus assembly protein PilX